MTHLMLESWIAISLLAVIVAVVSAEVALTVCERRTRRAARAFGRPMRHGSP